jgi:hypothetical protein
MTIIEDEFARVEHATSNFSSRWKRLMLLEKTSSSYSQGAFPDIFDLTFRLSRSVEMLFKKGWKHRQKRKPHVHAVFKITHPEGTLKPYLDYR